MTTDKHFDLAKSRSENFGQWLNETLKKEVFQNDNHSNL